LSIEPFQKINIDPQAVLLDVIRAGKGAILGVAALFDIEARAYKIVAGNPVKVINYVRP